MALPESKKITLLDLANPLNSADQIPVVQDGVTKRATVDQVTDATNTSCQCTLVSRSDSSSTPATTDEFYFETWQMPANTLSTDGSWLEIIAYGTNGANNNAKTLKMYFGSTAIYTQNTANLSDRDWETMMKF